ncbi:glycoside hydrolase family 9 protein [Streptosporangium sp. NBC_01639]|uniref:glycoside hydrolase family 9 protein n=1 Tax=Streptosporangium sp. NBC_01639 TaxID=2975948 RepID=UPI003865A6D0|nr:glycoside hydrolase family 9 protein [Streptosporangium sp. NBC_01639]
MRLNRRDHRRWRKVAAATATALLGAGLAVSPGLTGTAAAAGSTVKVNQVAYVPGVPKQATVVTSAGTQQTWTLKNSAGAAVATGQTTVKGADALSGDTVHTVDFSSYDTAGTGYTLSVGGETSYPFDISADPLKKLRYDALAFYYHQRSGIPIEAQHVGSAYARPAGHLNVSPNQGDNNVPCRTSCGYTLDVRGGWYDAGDHGKYVVNGGISAWQLLDEYERAVSFGDKAALGDGRLNIPEKSNGVPDILDEARWEVDFLLKMQAPGGLVHHKVADAAWTGLPTIPHQDSQPRQLAPVSTAATLNTAAVAAQCARLWKTIDAAFADRCLTAAEKAYTAAKANPALYAPASDGTGSGPYNDNKVTDEFYWAAAELYLTTGKSAYRSDLTGSPLYRGAGLSTRGFDWAEVGALGDISLTVVPSDLPAADIAATRSKIASTADGLLTQMAGQGYPAPFVSTDGSYYWGSNGIIGNNGVLLALAHDFTGQAKYRNGVYAVMDYFLGRNPLNQSYVSGYGEQAMRNAHHRFWANQLDGSLPITPPGVLSGGPNSHLDDPTAAARLSGCKPQKCYLDDINAYSVNEVTVNWNAPLAWLANWAAEKSGSTPPADTTPPTVPGKPAASAVTSTGVTLTWTASADPESGVAGYDVYRGSTKIASTTAGTYQVTGLIPDTSYTFSVVARNGAGLASERSPGTEVTTSGTPADTPPTAPGTPQASGVTTTGLKLTWAAATDDQGVAGYDVYQGSTKIASTTAATYQVTGLTPDTSYTFSVEARDTAGQTSPRSGSVTVRTEAGSQTGTCKVTYAANSWGNGMSVNVSLTNTGTSAVSGWTLKWAFGDPGQKITQFWSAEVVQSGTDVTARNLAWNGNLAPGQSTNFGFNGTHNGANPSPAAFTVNGSACVPG